MIELKEVVKENWVDCINLSLRPEQVGNLASNSDTIAQSKFETHHRVRAIYCENKVIGLLSYCHETDPVDLELFCIFRFMIDKDHQGKGYGSQALALVAEEIKAAGGKRIQTMHKPKNKAAAKSYRNFGFKEIGVLDDGDIHLEIKL